MAALGWYRALESLITSEHGMGWSRIGGGVPYPGYNSALKFRMDRNRKCGRSKRGEKLLVDGPA